MQVCCVTQKSQIILTHLLSITPKMLKFPEKLSDRLHIFTNL